MSTDTKTNFLGIPIDGDITKPDRQTPQRPLSELEPLIRAVLDDDTIHSFGWRQYTPYFNDGDPCVFGTGDVWVRTIDDVKPSAASDDDEEDDEEDDSFSFGYGEHPSLGGREYKYVGTFPNRQRVPGAYSGPDEARHDRCVALAEAIESDAFDDVLLEAFGDHALVTVRRAGITVESYEHE